MNSHPHYLFSDKLTLHVIDLTQIELATEEDRFWGIDYWARLFTATTWEEVKMIAEKDIHMKAAAEEMYLLSADDLIQERCRAREDFMHYESVVNKKIQELTEENERLRIRIAELESQT